MRRFFGALLMLVFALTVVGCVSNKKYNDVAEQLNNAQEQLDAANAQLTLLEQQKAALELQQQNLNQEKADLNARIAALEAFEQLSDELEEELAQLTQEKEALDAQIAAVQGDLAAVQELVAALSNRPIAPESLELFLVGSTIVGTSTNPAEPEIDYVVTPAGAYTGLYFEVEDPEIAKVDSLGRITGLKPGKTRVHAWSTLDASVKDVVDFEVIAAGADLDIVIAAVNEVFAQLNRSYVAEDLALMHASNPSVKISYLKGSEVIAEYVDGELTRGTGYYEYEAPAVDKLEKITVKGEYGANHVQHNMELALFVVADLANNAFNRVQMARDIVESYLLPYTSEVEKVSADLALAAEIAGVEIVYTSNAKQIISNDGAYARPLDDTKVNLAVMYKYQIPGGELYTESTAYDVYANGYSAEEKMEYIVNEGSLAFLNGYASNVSINLPAADDKFDAKLTYVSDKPEVYDNAGKYANQALEEATVVTYTVTFEYRGQVLGTKEIAVTANIPSVASKAANAFAEDNDVPAHFPYGVKGREGGNKLPGLVAQQVVGEDLANVTWEALEPELFSEGFVLNAQYLRYRETALKATFTNAADEEDKAELEIVINIGAGKTKDDIIVAGRFSQQSSQVYKEKCDTLNLFSHFDPMVGTVTGAFPTYYSGYMFSIQGEFRPNPLNPDSEIFYQGEDASRSNLYIRHDSVIYVSGKKESGEGIFDNSVVRDGTGGNWPVLYVNYTEEAVLVPFAVHVTGKGSDGEPIVSTGFLREGDLTVDGYRTCFIVNLETGEVVSGNGKGGLQFIYPAGTKYLNLPANHAIYCPRTQSNNAIYNGVFCVQGTYLEVNHHDLHPKNSYFINTANNLLEGAEASIAKLEAGEALAEGDANPVTALKNAIARASNAKLSEAEKAGFNNAKYLELAARYAALFDAELAALKASKGEIGFYMEDYVVALQAAYDKYAGLPEAAQNALAMKAWLLAEKALYLDVNWTITYHLNGGSSYADSKAKVIDLFFEALYNHLLAYGFNDWVSQKHDAEGAVVTPNVTHTLPSLSEFKNPDSNHPDAFINLMKGDDGGYQVTTQAKDPDHFALEWLFKLYKPIEGEINPDYKKLEANEKHFFNNVDNAIWQDFMLIIEETYLAGSGGSNVTAIRDIYNRPGVPVKDVLTGPEGTFRFAADRKGWGSSVWVTEETIKNWIGSYRHITQYVFNMNLASGNATDLALYPQNTHPIPSAEAAAKINNGTANKYNVATTEFMVPQLVKPFMLFDGWYLDEEFTQPVEWSVAGLGQQDVDVYAKFVGDPAHAKKVTIASEPAVEVMVPYGDKLVVPAVPAPEGKVFVGLCTDATLNNDYDLNTVVIEPFTLYPKYVDAAEVYVVEFVSNVEGVAIADQIIAADAADKKAVEPAVVNPGYKLVGWYKDEACSEGQEFDFDQDVAGNLKLYAKWGQTFDIEFDAGLLGYAIPKQSLLPGEKAVEPAVVYEGYSVEGWYKEKAFTNKFDFDVAPEGSLKLYAKLVINEHTLTFDNEGTALDPFTANYGAAIEFPADPVKEHYEFLGWYYKNADNVEVKFVAMAMPDASLALYSKYAPVEYTITLLSPDYSIYSPNKDDLLVDLFTDYHAYLGRTDSLSDFMHGAGNTTGYNGPWQGVKKFYDMYNPRVQNDALGVMVADARYYDKWLPLFDHLDRMVTMINSSQSMWGSNWTGNIRIAEWVKETGTNMGKLPYINMLPLAPTEIKYTFEDEVVLPKLLQSAPKSVGMFVGWFHEVNGELVKVSTLPEGSFGNITLHAVILSPEYEVKYYDGSTLLEKELLGVGQKISLVAPEKANHDFGGWYLDAGFGQEYDADAIVAADLTLYAKFTPVNRTLTFEENGGSAVADITVPHGTVVPEPAIEKEGFTFGGWYKEAALNNLYDFSAPVEASATLYAKWTETQVTLTFDSQGGPEVPAVTKVYNSLFEAPAAPFRVGYEFKGWFDQAGVNEHDFTLPLKADTTVYAKWEAKDPVNVVFDIISGTVTVSVTVEWGTTVAQPEENPTYEGREFKGWYSKATCLEGEEFNFPVVVTEDTTIYAKWTMIQTSVTFNFNYEGKEPVVKTGDWGRPEEPLAGDDVARTGYNFLGWYENAEGLGDPYNFYTNPIKEDIEVFAKYSPLAIEVSFNANGAAPGDPAAIDTFYDQIIAEPQGLTYENKVLDGWYVSPLFEGEKFDFAQPINQLADFTLHAKWVPTPRTVSFDTLADGVVVAPVVVPHGDKLQKPADPERYGYTFSAWYKNPGLTELYAFDAAGLSVETVEADMTLYAAWTIKQYDVTFDDQYALILTAPYEHGTKLTPPTIVLPKPGHDFGGWYKNAGCSEDQKWDFATDEVVEEMTLYGKWVIQQTTLTFNVGLGDAMEANVGDWGREIKATDIATPTYTGRNFLGWHHDQDCLDPVKPEDYPLVMTVDKTIYAKWELKDVSVTFDYEAIGGGTLVLTGKYGDVLGLPNPADVPATPLGKTFEGYFVSLEEGAAEYIGNEEIHGDDTVYAIYSIVQVTLTFKKYNGEADDTETKNYNSTFTRPADPVKEGHTFKDWYNDADGMGGLFDFSTALIADKTIHAAWDINQTVLTYEVNGGDAIPADSGDWGRNIAALPKPPVIKREGHDFKGWYHDSALTNPVVADDFPIVLKADKTVYAKWEIQTMTLEFDSNGGSLIATVSVPWGTIVVQPEAPIRKSLYGDPAKPNYIFMGWYIEKNPADCETAEKYDFTKPLKEHKKIYAHWHANTAEYEAFLAEVNEADYTALSWATYMLEVNSHNPIGCKTYQYIYETAMPAISAARAFLYMPSDSPATQAEFEAMLADPGVTEITLPAGGAFTMPAGPITHTVTIKSDNAGVPYDSWNAADVVTITGLDFDSVDGNLTLEGVKVIGDKAVGATSTSGDLTITNCIFENSDGAGNAIKAWVGGTITIENVLINGTATNYSGSGIVVL